MQRGKRGACTGKKLGADSWLRLTVELCLRRAGKLNISMCRPVTWTFFLLSLEANPEKFNSRFRNKMFYAGVSVWGISEPAITAALMSAEAQA